MRIELSVDIDRAIDHVFPLATGDVTKWSKTCVREEIIDEKPGVVGTTFRVTTVDRGREMEFEGTVTEHEPPNLSRVNMSGPAFDLDVLYTFETIDGGTRVTQASDIQGKGLFRVLLPVMGVLMRKSSCKAQADELDGLKRFCESQ